MPTMARARLAVAFTVVLTAFAVAVRAQSDAREQHVYVGVTTSKGAPVTGLGPKDFVVREDGRVREIIRVAPAPPPSHVALLVDNSQTATTMIPDIRDALAGFVQTFAGVDTPPAMSLVTYGERPTTDVAFTTSLPMLARAVVGFFARPGSGAYFLDAVVESAKAMTKAQASQPVIVALALEDSTEFSTISSDNVAAALRDAHASLWTVQLRNSMDTSSEEARQRDKVIEEVTTTSGGLNAPVLSRNGLAAGYGTVAKAILTRYDVVYGRPDTLVPGTRVSVDGRDRSWHLTAPRWSGK